MRKKMSVGIFIAGALKILSGIGFFTWIWPVIWGILIQQVSLIFKLIAVSLCLYIFAYIITGVFILALKDRARKTAIALDIAALAIDLPVFMGGLLSDVRFGGWNPFFYQFHLFIIIVLVSFICYLTGSAVKERFR